MRRMVGLGLVVALALVGSGCGGDDDESTDGPSEATATADEPTTGAADGDEPDGGDDPAAPGSGDCPYLSAEALEEAFGAPFEELAGAEGGCGFSSEDGLSVQLTRIDIQIDPETYAEESTDSCDEGTVVDVDAGDRAYACIAIGPSASYFEGDVLINLGVLSADDDQAVLDGFVEVLPAITVP